jgi:P27 family predicted phage terminase small subunit
MKSPSKLSTDAQEWWDKISSEYGITDQAGYLLLQSALEAFDRMRQAQEAIAEHGVCLKDRYDQLKSNPACAVERDSRSQMMQALKALNLDLEPLRDGPGRPTGV